MCRLRVYIFCVQYSAIQFTTVCNWPIIFNLEEQRNLYLVTKLTLVYSFINHLYILLLTLTITVTLTLYYSITQSITHFYIFYSLYYPVYYPVYYPLLYFCKNPITLYYPVYNPLWYFLLLLTFYSPKPSITLLPSLLPTFMFFQNSYYPLLPSLLPTLTFSITQSLTLNPLHIITLLLLYYPVYYPVYYPLLYFSKNPITLYYPAYYTLWYFLLLFTPYSP